MDGQGGPVDGQIALHVEGIVRTYPGVKALKGVNLTLHAGRVTALVGENGAGKSTLIRLIGGLETPDAGTISIKGRQVHFQSSHDSESAGISVVSQEFRLVPQLTVAENISLGHEPKAFGLVDRKAARQRASAILLDLGLDIDPNQRVDSLAVGDQQLVEIARALSKEFDILVMDEPSAALNVSEVKRLLQLVDRLRQRGKAILYVSHRLDEIFAVTDDITVFRDGQKVADLATAETTEPELVAFMLGRELGEVLPKGGSDVYPASEVRLEVDALECPRVRVPLTLKVARGEIFGIAGLVGSGRAEVMKSLFGALPTKRGEVRVDGKKVSLSSPAGVIGAGIFMLGEDRKAEGIFPHLSVLENLLVSEQQPAGFRRRKWYPRKTSERSTYQEFKDRLRIRVDNPKQLIGNLSGGNQQKVLFGRAVLSKCDVLLLNEPTRGVDIGAKIEIYQLIRDLSAAGVTVVVSSSEAAELAALVDRCVVLYAGTVTAELARDDVTEANIVSASVGQKSKEAA